ncbi:radiation insensitive 1 [Lycorma delicatula]|uniref:radiation insensitive 1 n=1 Tax=Lycorma delicatula TaxID=130591 RepID=UPI003F512374
MTSTSDGNECLFEAKLDNVKNLSLILKAINFKDNATCFVNDKGLKVVVEDSKCVQASAFIGEELFQEFTIKSDQIVFCVDLSVMVECLSVFDNCSTAPGITTALRMYYNYFGAPLKLLLEESGIITDCSIKTKEAFEILDFDFPVRNELNKVILRANDFKDILSDLDSNTESVEIILTPDAPFFRIATSSITSQCYVDIPKNSEMVETFLSNGPAKSKYKYSQIKPAIKILAASTKSSVRTNEEGLLCFQFMIKTISKQIVYVEYLCTPLIEDD